MQNHDRLEIADVKNQRDDGDHNPKHERNVFESVVEFSEVHSERFEREHYSAQQKHDSDNHIHGVRALSENARDRFDFCAGN